MLVVTAGDRAVTVRERAGIPNAGNNGRDPIGDRARSLTVTALSCGAYFMISWQMKFQLSGAPAVPPHFEKRNFSVRYGASIPDSDGRSRRASGSPGTKRIDFDFDFEPEKKETQTRSEPKPVSSDLGERNPNPNPNRE